MRRVIIVLAALGIMAAAIALGGRSTARGALVDDFNDNTTDGPLWDYWTEGGSNVVKANGRVEFSHPADATDNFGAGYLSSCGLPGDFDVQVDFDLLTWPQGSGVRFALSVFPFSLERTSFGPGGEFPGFPREVYVANIGTGLVIVGTGDMSGKLRLQRTGSTVTASSYNGHDWTPVASNPAASTEAAWVNLESWGSEANFIKKNVAFAMDNLAVTGARSCHRNGDVDCNGLIEPRDALIIVLDAAGAEGVSTETGCPDVGSTFYPSSGEVLSMGPSKLGDVNCDDATEADDLLPVLRHIAGLPTGLAGDCTPVGQYMPVPD